MVSPRVSTLSGREAMTERNPRRVMWFELLTHLGGWARLRPVTLAIVLAMLAESSSRLRLPIVEGIL